MKKLIAVFVVSLFACFAQAKAVFETFDPDQGTLVLYDDPCKSGGFVTKWFDTKDALKFTGCWALGEQSVDILWEDGDMSRLPRHVFKAIKES